MILITGAIFFTFVMYKNDLDGVLPYTLLWIVVIVGVIQIKVNQNLCKQLKVVKKFSLEPFKELPPTIDFFQGADATFSTSSKP